MGHFEYYQATSASVRDAAESANGAATSAHNLVPTLAKRHQAAAQEITADIGETVHAPMKNAGELAVGGMWAVAQLEAFADAIDAYNHLAGDPRSIDQLNLAWTEATTGDGAKQEPHDYALALAALEDEKARLDTWLDDQATAAAAALDHDPSYGEVLAAWEAGSLPATAKLVWTGLNLKTAPAQRLADALKNPALDAGLRQQILDQRPDVTKYAGNNCPMAYGKVKGPDGKMWDVAVPAETPAADYSVPHQMSKSDYLPDRHDGRWYTVGTDHQQVVTGESKYVFAAALGPGQTGWKSLGRDQASYLTVRNGYVQVNNGTQPLNTEYPSYPSDVPDPPDSGPENTPRRAHPGPPSDSGALPRRAVPGTYEPPFYGKGLTAASNGASLAVAAVQSGQKMLDAESARHYTVETVFQEDADGNRRAVIGMYQAVTDGNEVEIEHYYGQMNADGSITPITDLQGGTIDIYDQDHAEAPR